MKLILDGSHLYNKHQAGFKYLTSILPYISKHPNLQTIISPSPTGLFNEICIEAVSVQRRMALPTIPLGPFRKPLSVFRNRLRNRKLLSQAESTDPAVFHTFFYTPSPSPSFQYFPSALDAIPEKLGGDFLKATDPVLLSRKKHAFDKANHIVAISEQTRRDVMEVYGVSHDRISTVPLAVDFDFYSPPLTTMESERIRAKLDFDGPFLLQVGGRLHHKNFINLAKAFALESLAKDYQLVCVGEEWSTSELELLQALGIKNRTRLISRVNEADLKSLYQMAALLVYPSLYEGFGVPILEAMASGCIVLTSEVPVLRETAGDAAVYSDPRDPSNIAKKIVEILNLENKSNLRDLGRLRAQEFNWERTSKGLLEAFFSIR